MKARKMAFASYLIIFLACVWSCTNTAYTYTAAGFQETMKMFKYQFSNQDTYASKSVSYTIPSIEMETNTSPEQAENAQNTPEDTTTSVEKVAYLTFDDGPSPRTGEILDILAKHDIKATFFVIKPENRKYDEYLKRAADEGHTIGVHTASHKYKSIYSSVQNYVDDFTLCYNYIEEITGQQPTIFRFPGGSINSYNKSTASSIIDEMSRRGFVYFDWNVESNDSTGDPSASRIYNSVIKGAKGKERAVVIMHDSITRKTTVQALEDIIVDLKEQGFEFKVLNNDVKPVIFKIK